MSALFWMSTGWLAYLAVSTAVMTVVGWFCGDKNKGTPLWAEILAAVFFPQIIVFALVASMATVKLMKENRVRRRAEELGASFWETRTKI